MPKSARHAHPASAGRPRRTGRFGPLVRVAGPIAWAVVAGGLAATVFDRQGLALAAPLAQTGTCTVTGRLRLGGGIAPGGITVRANDAAQATTAADGAFRLAGLEPGALALRATRPRHLTAAADDVPCIADAVTTMGAVELPGGDTDGNDRVDLFDLVRVLGHYRQCAAEADFAPVADLDDNGCIDLFDLVRVTSTYGLIGPVAWPVETVPEPGPGEVGFRADVLPIFARDCRGCHGYVGGLNLDDHAHVMAGGNSGPVVVPGEPQSSLLYLKVSRQVAPFMPPGGVRLSDADIATIRRWIAAGAQDD